MFFRPAAFNECGPVEITINDIATTFANPKNYLKYLSGVVVYARDTWDTPMDKVRVLDESAMASIVTRCNAEMLKLYASIAALPWDERIRNGVKVYCRTMMMPWARSAGLWDTMLEEGFDILTPMTEQAYPALAGGEAAPVLGAVFLMGQGMVPESGLGAPPHVGSAAMPGLHTIALRGATATVPGDVESLIDAELVLATPSGYMLTERGRSRHGELLDAERDGLDTAALGGIYERFLALNGVLKSMSARASGATADDRFMLLAEFSELIERAGTVLRRTTEAVPRFVGYQPRLAAALVRAEGGEWEYVTSPLVDSVHTVWMELHEDYLQTLGRDREAEGSY